MLESGAKHKVPEEFSGSGSTCGGSTHINMVKWPYSEGIQTV